MSKLDQLNISYELKGKDVANDHSIISYYLEGGMIQTLDGDMHCLTEESRNKINKLMKTILLNPNNYRKR